MTSSAAFPTALIAHELNKNTVIDPRSPPMNISGTAMSIDLKVYPVIISTSSK
jgi:hypothetical protein